jgi:hypothetical protein
MFLLSYTQKHTINPLSHLDFFKILIMHLRNHFTFAHSVPSHFSSCRVWTVPRVYEPHSAPKCGYLQLQTMLQRLNLHKSLSYIGGICSGWIPGGGIAVSRNRRTGNPVSYRQISLPWTLSFTNKIVADLPLRASSLFCCCCLLASFRQKLCVFM